MDNTDKMVIAILAGAKAAADKKETPGQYILEYERMLRVFERRMKTAEAKKSYPSASSSPVDG